MAARLTVEKVLKYEKSLKNRAKRASKVFAKPFSKRLAGGKGTESPNTCSKIFSTNRVYRQAKADGRSMTARAFYSTDLSASIILTSLSFLCITRVTRTEKARVNTAASI